MRGKPLIAPFTALSGAGGKASPRSQNATPRPLERRVGLRGRRRRGTRDGPKNPNGPLRLNFKQGPYRAKMPTPACVTRGCRHGGAGTNPRAAASPVGRATASPLPDNPNVGHDKAMPDLLGYLAFALPNDSTGGRGSSGNRKDVARPTRLCRVTLR
jgi:hypothetical protein